MELGGHLVELRHLDTLVAIAETGSFTGAAEALHTVQSNVSEQVRQLEAEFGVPLLVRGRRGAVPTEFGERVLERARHIRHELVTLRQDLSMLQGLEVGHASIGVVGTISRWLVPRLVAEMRPRAPGVSIRVTEGASERLAADVADRLLALAVVTEPVTDPRLVVEHLRVEDLVALVPIDLALPDEAPIPLATLAAHPMVLPPPSNPLRGEVELAAAASGTTLRIPVEVEGIRLIADLVEAGVGVSVLPETAVPSDHPRLRTVAISDVPPRRLALVTARNVQLSLADQALRDTLVRTMRSS